MFSLKSKNITDVKKLIPKKSDMIEQYQLINLKDIHVLKERIRELEKEKLLTAVKYDRVLTQNKSVVTKDGVNKFINNLGDFYEHEDEEVMKWIKYISSENKTANEIMQDFLFLTFVGCKTGKDGNELLKIITIDVSVDKRILYNIFVEVCIYDCVVIKNKGCKS